MIPIFVLFRVKAVPAGHICAVFGLEELQLKSVTLSSCKYGSPLNVFNQGIRPLVKVNVEAVSASGKDISTFIVEISKLYHIQKYMLTTC